MDINIIQRVDYFLSEGIYGAVDLCMALNYSQDMVGIVILRMMKYGRNAV